MQQSEQINELAEALAKAQGDIANAKKASSNPHFKSNYADLAAIVTAIKSAFSANCLSYYQATDTDDQGNVILFTTIAHKSGQWVRSSYPVRPVQATPQGFGSALTYARRYSLAALAGVAAEDEDDDGNAASNVGGQQPTLPPVPAKKQTARARSARWVEIRDLLTDAPTLEELQAVWSVHFTEIESFGDTKDELYRIKDERKTAFQNDDRLRAGMPDDFNSVR